MKLTYNEFLVLTTIEKYKESYSQRKLSELTGLSLGTVNKVITILLDKKLISEDNLITKEGLKELEPFRVKRAIFLAAGFGSRMVPITLNTPKPMVIVNGKRIIETLLDAVVEAGIEEIIIVTGYLSEQFELLLKKYPQIKFIYNEKYNETNNISSAYLIRDKFANAYVLESDLVLYNKNLIRKYEYQSNFLGKYVSVTDDWCLETKNGIIVKEKVGGYNCYQMLGISYYEAKYADQMKKDLEMVFNSPGGKEKYWEQVFLDICKKNYQITVRECHEGDIIEIDTFTELKQIDPTYDKEVK
jgi:CTP:phosphocholine cytidylyltransferase-like protein